MNCNRLTRIQVITVESRLVEPRMRRLSPEEGIHTRMSEYTRLTFGITDEMVKNSGQPLRAIIDELDDYLKQLRNCAFTLITDGQNHLRQVLHPQMAGQNASLPSYFYSFYDLRKEFCKFYQVPVSIFQQQQQQQLVQQSNNARDESSVERRSHVANLTSHQLSILSNSASNSNSSSIVSSSEHLIINTHDHHSHPHHNHRERYPDTAGVRPRDADTGIESPPIISPLPSGSSDVSVDSGNCCSRHSCSPSSTSLNGSKSHSLSSDCSNSSNNRLNCMLNSPSSSSSSTSSSKSLSLPSIDSPVNVIDGSKCKSINNDDDCHDDTVSCQPVDNMIAGDQCGRPVPEQQAVARNFQITLTPIEMMLNHLSLRADASSDILVSRVQNIAQIIIRMLQDGHVFNKEPERIRDRLYPGLCKRSDPIDNNTVVRARGLPWQASDQDIARFFRGLNIMK